jgi:hypothetical protein
MNTRPNSSGPVVITEVANYFLVRIPSDQGERARQIPGRQWDGNRKMWVFPKDLQTYKALEAEFKAGADVFAIRRPDNSGVVQPTQSPQVFKETQTDSPNTEEEFEEQLTVVAQKESVQNQELESMYGLLLGVQEGMTVQRRLLDAILQKHDEFSERLDAVEKKPKAVSKEIQIVKELPDLLDLSQTPDLKLLEKALIGIAFVTCGRDQTFMNWVVKQKPLLTPFDFICTTHELLKQQLEKISGWGHERNFWELVDHIRKEELIFCDRSDPIQVFYVLGAMNSIRRQFGHPRSAIGEAEKMARSILYLMNLALVWPRVMVDEETQEMDAKNNQQNQS